MKTFLRWLMVLACVNGLAQDTVYLTDGSAISGKVLEVGIEEIVISAANGRRTCLLNDVLLIHYMNGQTETYTRAEKDLVVERQQNEMVEKRPGESDNNLVSVNTLGLANADFTCFYERLMAEKKIGLGIFAGYNFNTHVNLFFNAYLYPLHNAKKSGDIGFFANYYSSQFKKKRTFYYGIAVKYTPITFTSVSENSVMTGTLVTTNVVYTPARGRQVSTLITFGHHKQIDQHFYIRTMVGVGFFRLRGEYGRQYNYISNRTFGSTLNVDFTSLPKLYLAFHAGYRF